MLFTQEYFINHSENVFDRDNVKNLFRLAESLAIDSVTAKLGKLISNMVKRSKGRRSHSNAGKYATYEMLAEDRCRALNVRSWPLRGLSAQIHAMGSPYPSPSHDD